MMGAEESLKTRHDFFYFLMATENFTTLLKMQEQVPEIIEKGNEFSGEFKSEEEWQAILKSDEFIEYNHFMFTIRMNVVQLVVNSVLCLEALINDFALDKFSLTYFKKHLGKLSIVSKFRVIPNLQ